MTVKPLCLSTLKHLLGWVGQSGVVRSTKFGNEYTYLTPFFLPPLRAQSWVPAELKATLIGNSPPEDTGSPTRSMKAGLFGSMVNKDTVPEPALTCK